MRLSKKRSILQEYFSDERLKGHEGVLQSFLEGLGIMSISVYGKVAPVENYMQRLMARGASVHEAASLAYENLKKEIQKGE